MHPVGRVYRTGGIRGIYERAEQDHGGKRASFDLIRTIISPSVSMTDGERIKIIVDLDNKLKENRDKMLDERARFNTVDDAIKTDRSPEINSQEVSLWK